MRPFPRSLLIGSGAVLGVVLILLVPTASPVVSAMSGEAIPGVSLRTPWDYLLLAPVWGSLDFLTVRTVEEHKLILILLAIAFLAWRVLTPRRRRPLLHRIGLEAAVGVASIVGLLAFYALGALAHRPMAALEVTDPDWLVVDFHSHTEASHDGRPGFTVERNRDWHRGAGFHLAWITDHGEPEARPEWMEQNPTRLGDGTALLLGREVVYAGQHVAVLGSEDPHAVGRRGENCADWPVLIQTLPNDLTNVHPGGCSELGAGVRAIELVDGDPRGFGQAERERGRLLALADSLQLTLVSASNLHGWGRTAVSWNLVRLPGWQELTPEEAGDLLVEGLDRGTLEVEVVTVRRPVRNGWVADQVAAASLWSLADFASRRNRMERLSWLLWGVAAWSLLQSIGSSRTGAGLRNSWTSGR